MFLNCITNFLSLSRERIYLKTCVSSIKFSVRHGKYEMHTLTPHRCLSKGVKDMSNHIKVFTCFLVILKFTTILMIFISEINLGAVCFYFPSLKSQYFFILSFWIDGEIGHQAERERELFEMTANNKVGTNIEVFWLPDQCPFQGFKLLLLGKVKSVLITWKFSVGWE